MSLKVLPGWLRHASTRKLSCCSYILFAELVGLSFLGLVFEIDPPTLFLPLWLELFTYYVRYFSSTSRIIQHPGYLILIASKLCL